MSKEIKFQIKLSVDGKEQLQTVTTDARQLRKAMNDAKTSAQRFTEAFLNFNQGVEYVRNLTDAFSTLDDKLSRSRDVSALTGLRGEDMKKLRNGIETVADYFGKDFQEVLRATNALSKGFGIEMDEALKQVRGGLASGADAGGDFLDTLREYPRYFKEAGLSAEGFIAITANAAKQGVFSDKGVDVIKEGNIRLREMTKATADALEGIGISADLVQQQLREGSITTFEVMQQVAEKLKELPASSSQVGAAIADIFGGPGEDAGLEYIKTLANVKLSMDEVKAATNGAAKQQEDQIKQQEEIKNKLSDLIDLSEAYSKIKPYVGVAAQIGFAISGVTNLANALKISNIQANLAKAKMIGLRVASIATWNGLNRGAVVVRVFSMSLHSAAAAATAMKLALRGLLTATGVGAAIAAVTTIVEHLINSSEKAIDKTNDFSEAEEAFKSTAANAQVEIDKEAKELGNLIKAKEDTTEVVNHLNATYGDLFGSHKTAAEWYDTLTRKSKIYAKQLGYEAQAKIIATKLAEKEIELEANFTERRNLYKKGKAKTRARKTHYNSKTGTYNEYLGPLKDTPEYSDLKEAAVPLIKEWEELKQQLKIALKGASDNAALLKTPNTKNSTNKNSGSATSTHTNKSTHTDKLAPTEEGSLNWYEDKMEALRKSIKATADAEEAKKLQAQYEEYEKRYKDLEVEIGLKEPDEKEVKTHVEELQDKLRKAQKDFDDAIDVEAKVKADAEVSKLQAEIDEATRGQISIKADVEPSYIEKGSNDDKRISYGNARQKADRIQQDYEIGIIGKDEALRQIDELNKAIEEIGMKPIHIDVQTEDLEKARERVHDTRNALLNGWEGIKGVGDGIQNMTSTLEGNANAWEKMKAVIDGTIGIIQSVSAIVGMVNTLKAMQGGVAAADAAATAAAGSSATAAAAAAAGQGAQIAVAPGVIAANKLMTASYMELASAMYFAAHASIPLMGFGIAEGFITAATAMKACQPCQSLMKSVFDPSTAFRMS